MAMVVGRRVLGAFVSALSAGLGLPAKPTAGEEDDGAKWTALGTAAFKGEQGENTRREAIEGILAPDLAGWCEEQTTALRHALCAILIQDEDWLGAARALMKIPLEGGSRWVLARLG